MLEKIKAGLLGLAVGDALGVPVEFLPRSALDRNPVSDMRSYGSHGQLGIRHIDDAFINSGNFIEFRPIRLP